MRRPPVILTEWIDKSCLRCYTALLAPTNYRIVPWHDVT